MNHSKSLLFLALLGGSGIVTYLATSRKAPEHDPKQLKVTDSVRPFIRPSRRSESTAPLPLDKRKIERMDATNYEVTVSDIAIDDIGRKSNVSRGSDFGS